MSAASSDHPAGVPSPRAPAARRSWSLRWRLVLLVMVGIVPLLVFSLGSEYLGYREEVAATGRQTLALARSMSLLVEDELQVHIAALQALTVSDALKAGDFDGFRAQAETVVAQQFPGANILLLKEDGQQVMNTILSPGAPLPVRPNLESTRQVFATGRPAVSNLYQGAVGPRPVVAIDVPVKGRDGSVAYVLSLTPRLGVFANVIDRQHLPANWVIAVIDRRGVMIARIPEGDQFIGHQVSPSFLGPLQAGPEGIVEATSLEGNRMLSVFSHAEPFGWAIGIGVPRAELTGPAFSAALRTLAIGGVLLAVGLALALYVAQRIAGPIESLRQLATGTDEDALLDPPPTGLRETDEVVAALKLAEQNRKRAEQTVTILRDGIDTMPAGFVIYDDQDRLVMCNQSYRNFYPETADLLVPGVRFEDILREGLARGRFRAAKGCEEEWLAGRLRRQHDPHGTIEQRLGDGRWVLVTKSRLANGFTAGLRIDITERKQAEEAQRASEVQYRRLFEAAKDGILILDAETGMIMDVNPFLIEMLGYSHEAFLRKKLWEVGFFNDIVANQDNFEELQEKGYIRYENKALKTADGRRIEVEFVSNVYLVNDHKVIQCNIRDVTERKAAETERKAAERRIQGQLEHLHLLDHITRATGERQDLRSIFQVVVRSLEDSLPIDFGCVCLYDAAANALSVTCVGVKSEALAHELLMDERASIDVDGNGLGRCVQGQLVYEPDIGQVRFPFPERLARGGLRSLVMAPLRSESRVFGVLVAARRAAQGFSSVECEFLRQLSQHVALAAHQAQLYGALQQAYDDLRQTQQAMLQEERLRALGQMASGIAHDINNALSPVSLYAESMLETEINLSERARGYLETIQRAVGDVAQTVARMREFYRQRETQIDLTPVQMNSMVQQVVELTRARWSDMPQQRGIMIRAVTELTPDLPKIMGVESEIREALTNLVFNAVDAMPEGGTLTLRTRLADGDAESASVIVEVADSGTGMDDDARQRCLEPFFTTKGERGTGLGLAMVFGMVQRHGADLEIDSAPGAGTTMRLVFSVPAALATDPGRPAAIEAPVRLHLLLIDDDPILLKSLRDALEADGHVIVTANGGQEGIATFQTSFDRGEFFAAVITDLGMPYFDGRRVAAAVKQASPQTPVILLTGWGQQLAAEGDVPAHVDRLLAKPPRLRELRDALASLCRPAVA